MAASDTLVSKDGDVLDELLWRERGLGPADLPATLALNPGLGAIGAALPPGTVVALPATSVAAGLPLVNLWD